MTSEAALQMREHNRGETTVKSKMLITLLTIILVVVYAYLNVAYVKQRKIHEALTLQTSDIAQTLLQIPKPPDDLEGQLKAVSTSLAAEESLFPKRINSTQIINNILTLADECGVKAMPLVTQPRSTKQVGKHSYSVFRLNVAIAGSFSQLSSFVSRLETVEFKTLIVEKLSITRVAEQSGEGSIAEGNISVTASLDLAIYAQSITSY